MIDKFTAGIPQGFLGKLSWQYFTTIFTITMGFCYSLLIGRSLGVSEFGLFTLSTGFAIVIFQLLELRLNEAVIRYVAEFWEHKDLPRLAATLRLSLLADIGSGFLALFVLVALMPLAGRFLIHDERYLKLLFLAGMTVFCSNVATATALGILRTFGHFKAQSLVTVSGTFLKLLATYGAIRLFNCGLIGIMSIGIVSSFLMNAVMIWVALRCVTCHVVVFQHSGRDLLLSRIAEMRSFVASTYLFSLSGIPTKELDVILLGLFSPAHVVGVYKMAKNFITAMWAVSDPVFYVVYPELARLWARKEMAAVRSFLKRLTVILGASGVIVYLLAMLFVPMLIDLTLGRQFAEAAGIFRWMAWFILFWMPFLWINSLLLAAGKADIMLKAGVCGSILVLILYLVFIPIGGAKGAALAYAMGTPLGLVFAFWFAQRAGLHTLLKGENPA